MTIRDIPHNDRIEVHAHAARLMRNTGLTRAEATKIAIMFWWNNKK